MWLWFAAVQVIGAVMVILGAEYSAGIQVMGFAILLPGSIPGDWIAHFVAYHHPWRSYLWTHFQTDEEGLSQVLYLPTVVLMNCLAALIAARIYRWFRLKDTKPTAAACE